MKKLIVISLILLSACSSINNDLKNALAFGLIKDLNKISPDIEKKLFVRLYKSPRYEKNCFTETHGVCKYTYFLSVSTFDEYPETNIYRIKEKGEIIKIQWENEAKIDAARIIFDFNSYTAEALKNNNSLINERKIIVIQVNTKNITESK